MCIKHSAPIRIVNHLGDDGACGMECRRIIGRAAKPPTRAMTNCGMNAMRPMIVSSQATTIITLPTRRRGRRMALSSIGWMRPVRASIHTFYRNHSPGLGPSQSQRDKEREVIRLAGRASLLRADMWKDSRVLRAQDLFGKLITNARESSSTKRPTDRRGAVSRVPDLSDA